MVDHRPFYAQWLLILVTLLWGSTFLTIHTILDFIDPVMLVLCRFTLASLIMLVILKGRIDKITPHEWKGGFVVGSTIWAAYTLQCVGLQEINSSTSAFLTGLYVAFVPLCQWAVYKQRPSGMIMLAVLLAFIGMSLFANPFEMSFTGQWGEWVTILSAFICAWEILTISKFAPGCRPLQLSFTQLVFVAAMSAVTLLFYEPVRPTVICPELIAGVAALAMIVAFVQFGIGWALKYVSALRATLTYSLEPVFAGIIGWIAGEQMGLSEFSGAALIISAVVLSAWQPGKRGPDKNKD